MKWCASAFMSACKRLSVCVDICSHRALCVCTFCVHTHRALVLASIPWTKASLHLGCFRRVCAIRLLCHVLCPSTTLPKCVHLDCSAKVCAPWLLGAYREESQMQMHSCADNFKCITVRLFYSWVQAQFCRCVFVVNACAYICLTFRSVCVSSTALHKMRVVSCQCCIALISMRVQESAGIFTAQLTSHAVTKLLSESTRAGHTDIRQRRSCIKSGEVQAGASNFCGRLCWGQDYWVSFILEHVLLWFFCCPLCSRKFVYSGLLRVTGVWTKTG